MHIGRRRPKRRRTFASALVTIPWTPPLQPRRVNYQHAATTLSESGRHSTPLLQSLRERKRHVRLLNDPPGYDARNDGPRLGGAGRRIRTLKGDAWVGGGAQSRN